MKRILASILILISFSASKAQVLSVPVVTQLNTNWCWAACSQSVMNYFGLTGDTVAQCKIVDYVRRLAPTQWGTTPCCTHGGDSCNEGNFMWGPSMQGTMRDIYPHFNGMNANIVGAPGPVPLALTLAQVQAQIAANAPFILGWDWKSGGVIVGGHVIVGSGIQDSIMYVMDPWYGEGALVSTYAWVVNDSIYNGGGTFHVWDSTLTFNGNYTCRYQIRGSASICGGSSIALLDSSGGGTWSSSNTGIATIGSATGVATGVSAGTTTISYSAPCGVATKVITVTAGPASITGTTMVCTSAATTLSNITGGGTWSSSNTAVATVGTTGVVTGVLAGTATISYTQGCAVVTTVTVNTSPAAITGTASVCAGLATTLLDATTGGAWSSSNAAVASVGTGAGVTTGVAAGTAVISYTRPSGCAAVTTVTVNASPAPIGGTLNLCTSGTTTLTDATGSGAWSSSNHTTASIGSSSGTVTAGVSAGVVTISYTVSGCPALATLVVNTAPGTFTGSGSVCAGSSITLTNSGGTGSWSSSNTAVATTGSTTGLITGVSAGTATISYTNGCGTAATKVVTVNASPAAITGTANICKLTTTTLASATGGGTWSSSNTAVGTISSGGVAGGVSAGTCTITYTAAGCTALRSLTVNPGVTVAAITGATPICARSFDNLRCTTAGGVWTSSSMGVASVGSLSGVAVGLAGGVSNITYTVTSSLGCIGTSTVALTVNALPVIAAITGNQYICYSGAAATTVFACATGGGTWSSGNTATATVNAGGTVTSVATTFSNTSIIYTVSNVAGCVARNFQSVYIAANLPITGRTNICVGKSDTLYSSRYGTWSSANTAVGTVGSTTGIVAGVAAGTVTISYTSSVGCTNYTKVVTIITAPAAITGTTSICGGATTSLACTTTGGTWSSGTTTVATIGTSGRVTGVAAGTSLISYQLGAGCLSTTTVNVRTTPPANTGSTGVCIGGTTALSNSSAGGTWSSSSTAKATVGSTSGVVTGVATGTARITYSVGASCNAISTVTVNSGPAAITGGPVVYPTTSSTLSCSTAGGTWSSGNTGIVTVGSGTGVITGVSAGTTLISYTVSSGCQSTIVAIVLPTSGAISGPPNMCTGFSYNFSDGIVGGTWRSSNPACATIGASTGILNALLTGTPRISYTLSSGAVVVTSVTIYQSPDPIEGEAALSVGASRTYTSSPHGGLFSSSNAFIAGIVAATGVLTGVAPGNVVITYTVPTGCYSYRGVTVNAAGRYSAAAVATCVGSSVALSASPSNGAWSSSDNHIATVDPGSGLVTGISPGIATVTYAAPNSKGGYLELTAVTVNERPDAVVISASPGTIVGKGEGITFTASVSDNVINPVYQWQVNGVQVQGADQPIFTSNSLSNNDLVSCLAGSNSECTTLSNLLPVTVINDNVILQGAVNVNILPNPNNGEFVIKGSLGTAADEAISLQITDLLGQVVYKNNTIATNGNINEPVALSKSLANGMYILNIRTEQGNFVFHFIVQQ